MAHSIDDTTVTPEILTLHWEGPASAVAPPEHSFPDSADEASARQAAERERELALLRRTSQGREIWQQIEKEAARKGDTELWRRKLHAYWWVKMKAAGNAGDFGRRFSVNHATARTWISDVAKLAYEVGYRLHEDRLLLVGDASPGLQRLRELVNRDASAPAAAAELEAVAPTFRGEDPYFHLNEAHVLRAHDRLRESDATLRDGLTIAEARRIRSLLWNARGQTYWDCTPESEHPLSDYLACAERAFRRAAVLDPTLFFPFVNLAQMAMDRGDPKRCEYWIGELGTARKRMAEDMTGDLAKYLSDAEWTRPVETKRFWQQGPVRWIAEAACRGAAAALAAIVLCGALAVLGAGPATAASPTLGVPDAVEHGGRRGGGSNSGAGGN